MSGFDARYYCLIPVSCWQWILVSVNHDCNRMLTLHKSLFCVQTLANHSTVRSRVQSQQYIELVYCCLHYYSHLTRQVVHLSFSMSVQPMPTSSMIQRNWWISADYLALSQWFWQRNSFLRYKVNLCVGLTGVKPTLFIFKISATFSGFCNQWIATMQYRW